MTQANHLNRKAIAKLMSAAPRSGSKNLNSCGPNTSVAAGPPVGHEAVGRSLVKMGVRAAAVLLLVISTKWAAAEQV